MPLEQMDGAQYTLRRMPYVGLAIAAIVCIILGPPTRSSCETSRQSGAW